MFTSIPFVLSLFWSKLQIPYPSLQLRELPRSKANASSNFLFFQAHLYSQQAWNTNTQDAEAGG